MKSVLKLLALLLAIVLVHSTASNTKTKVKSLLVSDTTIIWQDSTTISDLTPLPSGKKLWVENLNYINLN